MFTTRLLLIAFVVILIPPTVSAITIHGTVYEWSTFEPLDNALVEVNSTPTQFRVASSGVYSFNLPPGDYLIKTSYYQNSTLVYYSEDTLTVTDYEGDYVFDILMFPLQEDMEELPDLDIGNITYDVEDNILPGFDLTYTIVALLLLIMMGAAAYYHYKRKEGTKNESEIVKPVKSSEIEEPVGPIMSVGPAGSMEPIGSVESTESVEPMGSVGSAGSTEPIASVESTEPEQRAEPFGPTETVPVVHSENACSDNREPAPDMENLPEDLKEIIEILEKVGGRMTQKDLRARLNFSEAKVSLMITDLEDRRLVHKVKKGRGNIILLRPENKF